MEVDNFENKLLQTQIQKREGKTWIFLLKGTFFCRMHRFVAPPNKDVNYA